MMSLSAPQGPGIVKALILSLLAHLLVGQLFLFQWPLKRTEPRPQLVFFGAVLEHSELTGTAPDQTDERTIIYPRRIYYHAAHTEAPYADRSVRKPAYPEAAGKTIIAPMKVNYLPKEDKPEPAPEPIPVDADIPEAPQYQPLRLNPK